MTSPAAAIFAVLCDPQGHVTIKELELGRLISWDVLGKIRAQRLE